MNTLRHTLQQTCWSLLYLLLSALPVWGTSYYVDKDAARCAGCSDSNTCVQAQTITTGRDTINKGIECLTGPDDILYIRGATAPDYLDYAEAIQDRTTDYALAKIPPNGSDWDHPVTIAGYQNERVRINPTKSIFTGSPANGLIHFDSPSAPRQYIVFDNLYFDANNCSLADTAAEYCFIFLMHTASHIKLQNSFLVGGRHSPILVVDNGTISPTDIIIDNNDISDCGFRDNPSGGTVAGHCIYMSASGNTIKNNFTRDSGGSCIHVYGSEINPLRVSDDNIVYGNRCTNNSRISNGSDSAYVISGDRNLVYNNLCFNCRHDCFAVKYKNALDNELYYNTCAGLIKGNKGGFHVNSDARNTTLRNNLCWNGSVNAAECYRDERTANPLTVQSNNLFGTADPLWVTNYTNTNTKTGSPARNAGVTVSGITTDIDGNARDGTPDIGAREFLATPVSPLALEMSVPPASGLVVNTAFDMIVRIVDAQSALQDIDSGDCSATLTAGTATLTAEGTATTVTPVDGICTFNLSLDAVDDDFQITVARASTTSAVSPIFFNRAAPVTGAQIRVPAIVIGGN